MNQVLKYAATDMAALPKQTSRRDDEIEYNMKYIKKIQRYFTSLAISLKAKLIKLSEWLSLTGFSI